MRIAITPRIEELARAGAWFVTSVSGGKDSSCAMHVANEWLDGIGHPRDRRLALHADLGRAEWPDTLNTVRRICRTINVPVEVVSQTNDLAWRFEDRWRRSLDRYRAMETIALVPPWSSSSLLFCRSEQKTVPLSRRKAKLPGDLPVVGIVGIRREESRKRAQAPVDVDDGEMMRRNGRAGVLWHPIVDWTAGEVFDHHHRHAIPLHRAYGLGSTRLSCALCTIASRGDLTTSVSKGGNIDIFRRYVSLEVASAFSFQPSNWLADLVDDIQTDAARLVEAKRMAAERMDAQRQLPDRILRQRSIRNIDKREAAELAAVRRRIGDIYGINVTGATEQDVLRIASERELTS